MANEVADAKVGDEPSLLSFTDSEDDVVVEEEPQTDITISIGSELYRFTKLDSSLQFTALPERLQFFYHYITEACWCGSLIVFFQTSAESPFILLFLLKLLTQQSLSELRTSSEGNGISQEDFNALIVYAARFFSARGNYYETRKFSPSLPQNALFNIMESSLIWGRESDLMLKLWKHIVVPMYSENSDANTHLQSPGESEDARVVREYLVSKNIPFWNVHYTKSLTREGTMYNIKIASIDEYEETEYVLGPEMCHFKVTKGNYSFILKEVVKSLLTANLYATDDLEKQIIDYYITSFQTGAIADHKEGSRLWMNTGSPYADWYLGFIEILQHPTHGFAEFQGFVGLQNLDLFHFYKQFLASAGKLIHLLPWDKEYKTERFITPQLIIVHLLIFCGRTIPNFKNVPLYDEITDTAGFKNIIFFNLISDTNTDIEESFLRAKDVNILRNHRNTAHKLQLGLKLVLGYGSGMLFRKEGKLFNFPVRRIRHPILNDKIRTWYEEGETFSTKFGELSMTFEECRAICVAMYLSTFTEVVSLFEISEEQLEDVIYSNWLWQIYVFAIESLRGYDTQNKQWFDAKAQAGFVILRMLLEEKERVVHISEPEYGKKIVIHVDRTKILTAGRRVLGDFMTKLHIFKCTADVVSARKLYNYYSVVPEEGRYPLGRWKMLTTANRPMPIRLYVQCNTLHVLHDTSQRDGPEEPYAPTVGGYSATTRGATSSALATPQKQPRASERATHNNPKETKRTSALENNAGDNLPHTSKNINPNSEVLNDRSRQTRLMNISTSQKSSNPTSQNKPWKPNSQSFQNDVIDNPKVKNMNSLIGEKNPSKARNNNSERKDQNSADGRENSVNIQNISQKSQENIGDESKNGTVTNRQQSTTPSNINNVPWDTSDIGHNGKNILQKSEEITGGAITSQVNNTGTSDLGDEDEYIKTEASSASMTSLTASSDMMYQLTRKATEMTVDVMPKDDEALMRSFYERPYHPLLPPASATDLHAGRGVALELMERVLTYGDDVVGSRFQILVQMDSDDSKESLSDHDAGDITPVPSITSTESEMDFRKPAYPMTDDLPEGINVKVYPLTPEGLIESFLDKCPPDIITALTQHFLKIFDESYIKAAATTLAENGGESEKYITATSFA
ncbi:hypothetical protein PR048_027275 [Dryococelus australis]|uniref:Uncharacterized protein n=1 Tax=Dryococelus australis TaxID=614101 RepID=A0ABQ9GGE1_9NEOP|nr:hypothetical protein PR048_027275 [Dryococelus australis]